MPDLTVADPSAFLDLFLEVYINISILVLAGFPSALAFDLLSTAGGYGLDVLEILARPGSVRRASV